MSKNFQPPLSAVLLSLLVLVILVCLGAWQMQRLNWKTDLLARIQAQMLQPAALMPEEIDDASAWEYRRATVAGKFLYDHEFLVKPRTYDGKNGYHMLVPLMRASGGVVFVNRGWVSDASMSKVLRPNGFVQIEGIVQVPHATSYTPVNKPEINDWYWADLHAMSEKAALANVLPVVIHVAKKEPGVYPIADTVEVAIRNDHLQYAIFWFVMALVSQVIFIMRFWKKNEVQG